MAHNKRFRAELRDQPAALRETLSSFLKEDGGQKSIAELNKYIYDESHPRIIYTGMGSSFYMAYVPIYYLSSKAPQIPVALWDTGEFTHYMSASGGNKDNIVIAISQSGESGEIVRLIEKWKENNIFPKILVGVTNTFDSTLARESSITFITKAGLEMSVTSKTYTSGLLLNYLIAYQIAHERPPSSELIDEITKLINKIETDLIETDTIAQTAKKMVQFLNHPEFLDFIGQGTALSTVHQAALNYKEITKRFAEGLSLAMFRHGPIEIVSHQFRAVIIVNDEHAAKTAGPMIEKITTVWGEGKVVLISNQEKLIENLSMKKNRNLMVIPVPIKNQYLSPIYEIAILQEFFCQEAESRGLVPGIFRNSQKITK